MHTQVMQKLKDKNIKSIQITDLTGHLFSPATEKIQLWQEQQHLSLIQTEDVGFPITGIAQWKGKLVFYEIS